MKGLIFTYALCYGGAAASLFNPYVGLLIYVCFAIIKPESMWYWAVPEGNYSRIVAVALLAGWAIKGFGDWRFGRARAAVVALLGYWLCTGISIAWSIDQERARTQAEAVAKIVLPFLVGITMIDSVAKLKQMAWVIFLSEAYVALEFNLTYFAGYNRLRFEGFGSMDNNCNAIALVTCFGLAFFLGLSARRWWVSVVVFALAGLIVHAILFSFSRGGMLSLGITGAVSFLLLRKQPRHYLLLLLGVAAVIQLAGPQVVQRFQTTFAKADTRDASAQGRLELWAACWDLIQKTPTGVGADHFPLVVDQYGFERGKEAHTLWLQVGAEVGIQGLACLILFYGLCVIRLLPIACGKQAVHDPWFQVTACMVIAALLGFAVSAQFVSLKNLEHPFYITMLGAAVLKLSPEVMRSSDPNDSTNTRLRLREEFVLER